MTELGSKRAHTILHLGINDTILLVELAILKHRSREPKDERVQRAPGLHSRLVRKLAKGAATRIEHENAPEGQLERLARRPARRRQPRLPQARPTRHSARQGYPRPPTTARTLRGTNSCSRASFATLALEQRTRSVSEAARRRTQKHRSTGHGPSTQARAQKKAETHLATCKASLHDRVSTAVGGVW